jgi:hypothetical protein
MILTPSILVDFGGVDKRHYCEGSGVYRQSGYYVEKMYMIKRKKLQTAEAPTI